MLGIGSGCVWHSFGTMLRWNLQQGPSPATLLPLDVVLNVSCSQTRMSSLFKKRGLWMQIENLVPASEPKVGWQWTGAPTTAAPQRAGSASSSPQLALQAPPTIHALQDVPNVPEQAQGMITNDVHNSDDELLEGIDLQASPPAATRLRWAQIRRQNSIRKWWHPRLV